MKSIFASKTFWVNALTLVASGLAMFAGNESVSPGVVAIITGIAIPIVNVVLRFLTDKPVNLTGKSQPKGRQPFIKS